MKPPKHIATCCWSFAERVERLPIAIAVGADMLRRELDPVPETARGLRLERLRNEVHDVAELLRRAVTDRPELERRLLGAMAICSPEGFWFPLGAQSDSSFDSS